jgi:hypothetical protein
MFSVTFDYFIIRTTAQKGLEVSTISRRGDDTTGIAILVCLHAVWPSYQKIFCDFGFQVRNGVAG